MLVQGAELLRNLKWMRRRVSAGKLSRPFQAKLPILTQLRYLLKCMLMPNCFAPKHPRNLQTTPRNYPRGSAAFKSFASHFFLSQACNFVALMSLRTCVRRAAIPLSWHSRMTSATMPLKAKISQPALAGSQKVSRASIEDLHFH